MKIKSIDCWGKTIPWLHLFDLSQNFNGVSIRRWILMQLRFQTIPECSVHYLLHSVLQTVEGDKVWTGYCERIKNAHPKMKTKVLCCIYTTWSPSFRKFCRFDLKRLVDHYLMSQSQVGDTLGRLHQLLHRDKLGRTGWKNEKVLYIRTYTSKSALVELDLL